MGAFLLTLGVVAGLIRLAAWQADEPSYRRYVERRRLAYLARNPDDKLTLTEAEDALVLARRWGEKDLVKRFERMIASRKRRQPARRLP